MSKMIKIGVANQSSTMMSLEDISDWEPKNITYTGTAVFFKAGDMFYSMGRVEFESIFKKRP